MKHEIKKVRIQINIDGYRIPSELLFFSDKDLEVRAMDLELKKIKVVNLGIADYTVNKDPTIVISRGIGSCIFIGLYDRTHGIGGAVHAMLPYIKKGSDQSKPAKYVDSGIQVIVNKMMALGCKRYDIFAKIAGGAKMFKKMKSAAGEIGKNNIKSARDTLKEEGIIIKGEDVGGDKGRTVMFNTFTGTMLTKTVWGQENIF